MVFLAQTTQSLSVSGISAPVATVIAATAAVLGGCLVKLLDIISSQASVTRYKAYLDTYKLAKELGLTTADDELWAQLVVARVGVEADRPSLHLVGKIIAVIGVVAAVAVTFGGGLFGLTATQVTDYQTACITASVVLLFLVTLDDGRINRRFVDVILARLRAEENRKASTVVPPKPDTVSPSPADRPENT